MIKSRLQLLARMINYYYSINPVMVVTQVLARIVHALLGIAGIFVAGRFIDGTVHILTDWESFSFSSYIVTDSFHYLILGLIIVCIMHILAIMALYFNIILEGSFRFKSDMDILKKISQTNLQEIEEKDFQDLINYVPQYSTKSFLEAYNHVVMILIHSITLFSAILMLFRVMGAWSLLLILFVLPETAIEFIRYEQIRKYVDSSIAKVKFMNYIRLISTRVPDFPELRVTGVFKHLKKLFRKKGESYYSGFYSKHFHLYSDKALFSVLGQIILTIYIIYILAFAVVRGITIGQFSALVNYARTGYNAGYHCINHIFHLFNDLLYVKSFFRLLDYENFGDLPTGDELLKKSCPTLEFRNLTFSYPKTKEKVVNNISLKIEPGEMVAFVGSSGSGKSSTVRILCGLFQITSGDYLIDGHSVKELKRGELKNKISVMFQDFVRYNFSLKKNITIGNNSGNINQALYDRVKKIALVDEFMKRLDVSDTQFLGKFFGTGKELSPGHWQKLAIARMLYRNKDIMIMDEPFTFIDGFSKSQILEGLIEFVGAKKILIYITQDTDHLDKFDRVYYFKKGKIVEHGTAKELLAKKGEFYKEAEYNK